MSSDTVVARVSFTDKDRKRFDVLSVWSGRFKGSYSVRKAKGNDKYPSIGLFDALKAWGLGDGYIDVTIESQRERTPEQRSGGSYDRAPRGNDDFGGGGDDPEIPFRQRGKRQEW
jgi:hypothetical protein